MKIVSNTGPLIALSHISNLGLLTSIFSEVLIPTKVLEEFRFKGNESLPALIEVKKIEKEIEPFLKEQLDAGEREVISLAISEKPDFVLIDERKGRKIAEVYYNLPILGTAGLLLLAKKKGFVEEVKPLLDEIRKKGYFISNQIFERTIQKAGE